MRIGLIAPPWLPVPPPGYGGTEVVIDNLARGLQELGHDVRLFTVGDSTCPVPLEFLYPTEVTPMDADIPEAAHVLAAYDALADVDIIHDHTILGPLVAGRRGIRQPPVVTTNHGLFTSQTRRIFAEVARHAWIVAISHSQALASGGIPIASVIHHGIDLEVYQPGPGDGGYLLFVGRMCADKGVHLAVRVARRAGQRLVIVAKMREPAERAYFEQRVRPLLGPGDEHPGRAAAGVPAGTDARGSGPAQPDHLARAVRPGDGRGAGVGDPGASLPQRRGARNRRPGPHRVPVPRRGTDDHRSWPRSHDRAPPVPGRCGAAVLPHARMALDHQRLYRRILCDPGQLRRRSAACATAAPDRREYCGTASQVQQ